MDRWKFFDITHREHVFCNPMSIARFDELLKLLGLEPGNNVLEIARGPLVGQFMLSKKIFNEKSR